MPEAQARSLTVRGVVQGVGFRPFVYRLAREKALAGWVLNEEHGVEIHVEGAESSLTAFVHDLAANPPPAARIASVEIRAAEPAGVRDFEIRPSELRARPAARISVDLPVCPHCLDELSDPLAPRYGYPYINCTDCGPRYSIVRELPYDRSHTTMSPWRMDAYCATQYGDPADRRFHAQPIACPACGPHYYLEAAEARTTGDRAAIEQAAGLLAAGSIVAIKGVGGYHLACDAQNARAVQRLRDGKYRKEKPFAIMARTLDGARRLADLSRAAEELLVSTSRPIVLAPARMLLEGVAPGLAELGMMLPYAPLHHLLFHAGAPKLLVMTSGNRSSEPVAYQDEDARANLRGLADAFLIGERPIARRVDDSVARAGVDGPMILRRARGLAPGVVAQLPGGLPILALGADLKNTIALAVDGDVVVSPHIGDLEYHQVREAFRETIHDLLRMYEIRPQQLRVAYDRHPQYRSTLQALDLPAAAHIPIQHHRAHVASVLAENEEWHRPVIGVALDGSGYGDDGGIWGGEIFLGSVAGGFRRIAHLREAALVGGDAAVRHPVQAAAGFLAQQEPLSDLGEPPFTFPNRYRHSMRLLETGFRIFKTTSVGRLFDTAAALAGFTRAISFEGQAAMWLENLARKSPPVAPYAFPFADGELDFRPLLTAVWRDRLRGREPACVARAFHRGLAEGIAGAVRQLGRVYRVNAVVLSGGVWQNQLLLDDLLELLAGGPVVLRNHIVPPNDGGISLGQAALAAIGSATHA
jgi:hydrogenase maturation protein HypF